MFVVVTYDIADDKRRYQVARILEDHGLRVQESVFDCIMDERRFLALKRSLEREIDQNLDSVRFYFLCERCREKMEVLGLGVIREPRDVMIL